MSSSKNIRDYSIITLTYWGFTLSDGALRMLLLLHLHERGYSALTLASLFILYEFFGIITNLISGWLSTKSGLKLTLGIGLSLQIIACGIFGFTDFSLSVGFITTLQGLSGIAKDFTKMSSKSYIKMVVPDGDQSQLLKWVALLTGSKNTLKGVGYFLGGLLLTTMGFQKACAAMAVYLGITLIMSMLALPNGQGKSRASVGLRSLIPTDKRLIYLSASRLFLFGSRDTWFVVGLPIFLSTSLGWSFESIGGFLALWIIGYGIVQASAPSFLGYKSSQTKNRSFPASGRLLARWKIILIVPLILIAVGLLSDMPTLIVLVVGLGAFGVVFAMNSAFHSFLVLNYAEKDSVALSVGFYYMSNAAGRLVGTVLSGVLYQAFGGELTGLIACIAGATLMAAISATLCVPLIFAEQTEAM